MNKSEMASILEQCQEEESFLREQGQKEYAREEDNAFGNFERVGNTVKCVCEHCGQPTRIGRMAALMVYLLKHVDGILSFVAGHKSQREDVRGRINDVRVYGALLRGMVEEEGKGNLAPGQFSAQLRPGLSEVMRAEAVDEPLNINGPYRDSWRNE